MVDENQGDRLVEQLHDLLIRPLPGDPVMGPTWEQLFAKPEAVAARAQPWWATKREALLGALAQARLRLCLRPRAGGRRGAGASAASSPSAARCSRSRPIRIRTSCARSRPRGWGSIACRWRRSSTCSSPCPGISPDRILFTPNFAPRAEYERALALGVHVTIDNLFVLQHWLDAFKGKSVFLRIDTGIGRGHHHHVKTAGAQSKFGIPAEELDEVARLAKAGGVTINGLHAHAGSGVFDVDNWTQVGSVLVGLVKRFPDVKYIDVGGGLGVPDRVEGRELDLARLDAALAKVRQRDSRRHAVARARTLPRGQCRRAAGARHADQDQERHSLRRRGHRHELADSSGAVRRASRHRESHAVTASRRTSRRTWWARSARARTSSGTTGCCRNVSREMCC